MADDGAAKVESSSEPTSKTIVLVGHGGYDKLKIQNMKRPTPGKGQILLNVKRSGINFSELMCRQGLYDQGPKLPAVLGIEAAGIVAEVGEEASKFKGGERVVAVSRFGLWSEYAAVDEVDVLEIPDEMTFDEAAALPVTYLTSHVILFNFGNLRPNQSVLVHMAAGGVGTAATQLCKTVEGVTVFGTCSASKHDQVKENGVTHPIDYRTVDYVAEVKKECPDGVDIVMDPLSGEDAVKGYNLLKPLGKIIHYGAANFVTGPTKNYFQMFKTWWSTKTVSPIQLMQQNKAVCGVNLGYMNTPEQREQLRPVLKELLDLYKEGKIKPVIDSVWAFENVGRAMAKMHERKNVGKVILSTEKEPEPEPEPEKKKEKKRKDTKKEKKPDKKEAAKEKEDDNQEKKEDEGEEKKEEAETATETAAAEAPETEDKPAEEKEAEKASEAEEVKDGEPKKEEE